MTPLYLLAVLTLAIFAFPDPRYAAAVGCLWFVAAGLKHVQRRMR